MKTFCAQAGCTSIATDSRWCPLHLKNNDQIAKERARKSEQSKFYRKRAWRDRIHPMKLRRNPICQDCNRAPAVDIHHKVKFGESWELFSDFANLLSLCKECHTVRTMRGE